MTRKRLVLLGATGSIGTQTLDVIEHTCQSYDVIGLSAGRNLSLLKKQIVKFPLVIAGLML